MHVKSKKRKIKSQQKSKSAVSAPVRNYDKKIFRLVYILNRLNTGKPVSMGELKAEFNVTIRSIQRDIELLGMAGFPLVSSGKGCYTFMEGFSLKKMMISGEEASLLAFLFEIARSLGENFESSFRGILQKVLAKDSFSPFYAKIPDGLKLRKDYPYVNALKQAIGASNKIILKYRVPDNNKEKTYRLRPLRIIFYEGFWYLLAQVEGKSWIPKFRLERITEVRVLDETFVEPENLKTILDESVNAWFREKRDTKVVLKVASEVARFFKQKRYFPQQKIKKQNKDGSLIIELKASNFMEVTPVVYEWIPYIRVIEPTELKEEIKKKVEKYLKEI